MPPRSRKPSPTTPPPVDPAEGLTVVWWDIDAIHPAPDNPRHIPPEAVEAVAASLRAFGWRQPILVDAAGVIIAGHTRRLAALALDYHSVPVVVCGDLTPDQVAALRLVDNRAADFASWDGDKLARLLGELPPQPEAWAFDTLVEQLAALTSPTMRGPAEAGAPLTQGDGDAVPEARADVPPDSVRGHVYELGPHRLLCGSATDAEGVALLLRGVQIDGVLMDPPYCSGGFQEAGKMRGSIGSKRINPETGGTIAPRIAGDTLSTRGFAALIGKALDVWAPPVVMCFTDWRMWIPLYDLTEAAGLGVRAMLVWDKGHPGMGRGFRAQHELIMLSVRGAGLAVFDPKKSRGNVLTCKRSGNALHPTQKPVELLGMILDTADFLKTVGDPFGGSGSTLIAAAQCGRRAVLSEVDPVWCDVIRRRWTRFAAENGVEAGPGALA